MHGFVIPTPLWRGSLAREYEGISVRPLHQGDWSLERAPLHLRGSKVVHQGVPLVLNVLFHDLLP